MLLALLFTSLFLNPAFAYLPSTEGGAQNELPDAIEGVGITENLNSSLPGDVLLIDEQGEKRQLSSFFNGSKPIILSLVYYSCPSLCNLHLKGVFDVLTELGLNPGQDFEFLAVSFDPKETSDVAAAKRDTYIQEILKMDPEKVDGIHFLTAAQKDIDKLSSNVGFRFKWNAKINEWAHASAAIISTPSGVVSRYLHGVYFDAQTFRLSVVEASKGEIGNITDNFALFCFRYDPKTNKYSIYVMNILRGVAGLVLVALLFWLVPFWLRSRKEWAGRLRE